MADRDYIIEVILKARDDMAGAFAAATGEIDALDKKLDEQKAKTEASRLTQKDYARELESGTSSVKRYNQALGDLNLKAKDSTRSQKDLADQNNRVVNAHIALENATRRLVATQNSGTASQAQYVKATQSVRNAELELGRALTASTQAGEKATQAERNKAQARAKSVRTEIEYQQRLDLTARSLQKQADAESRLAAAATKAEAQRSAAIDRTVESTKRYADVMARSTSTQTEEVRATRELEAARDRLNQLGLTTEQAEERIHSVRQQALEDYGHESQAIRDYTVRSNAQVEAYKLVEKATRDVDAAERSLASGRRTRGGGVSAIPRQVVSPETTALAAIRPIGQDAGRDVGSLGDALSSLQQHFKDLDTSTSGFTTHIRGAFGFAAVALVQPLAALIVGLVGSFGALASAALAAGAAIGAGFVSAVAEGVPALGLFAAAMQRLQGVMGYVQGLMQQQQQAFIAQYITARQNALGINQVAIAQHNYSDALFAGQQALLNVVGAEHSYSDALFSQRQAVHNVSVAQLALDTTRRDATRQLQDLIFQETNARLAAEASTLAVTNSQKALAQAIVTGGDVQAAQLGVAQAQAGHTQAVAQAQRAISDARPSSIARRDIAETVTAANLGVEQARHAVVDADFALRQAAQGIVAAKRAVVDAGFQIAQAKAAITLAQQAAVGYNVATAAQLAYLRSQMSATEFALTKSIMRILDLFRGAHAYTRPLTDAILGPFLGLTNRIYATLKDPRVFRALQDLAGAIGSGLSRVFNAIFSPQSVNAFITILQDGAKNIAPLANIAVSLFKVLQQVVITTGPLIRTFLGYVSTLATQFAQWATSTQGKNWLKQFFTEGFAALQAFMNLGLALIRLFLTIAGPGGGAKTGIALIQQFTRVLNNLTNDLNNKHSKAFKDLQKLWASAAPTLKVLGSVLGAVFSAFFQLGTSKQGQSALKNIADLVVTVLIPAFVKFATWLGSVSGKIIAFISHHPALKSMLVDLIAGVATLYIGGKALGLLFGPLSAVLKVVRGIGDAFGIIKDIDLAKVFGGIASKAGDFAKGFGGIFKGRTPKPGAAAGAGGDADIAASLGTSAAGAAEVGGPEVAAAGAEAVGGTAAFAGAATGIGLVVAAIVALAKWTGTLKDLWNAIKAPFVAIWQAIQQPIQDFVKQFSYMISGFEGLFKEIEKGKGVFGFFRSLIGDVLRPAFKILGDILGGIGKLIGNAFGTAIKVFSGFFEIIGGILHGNIGKIWDGAKKIGKALLDGITSIGPIIGSTLWNIVKDAFNGLLKLGGFLLNLGGNIGGKIVDGILGALKGLAQGALGLITGAINEVIIAPINWLIDRINGLPHIKLPFGLGTIAIPHIDHISKLGGGGGGGHTVSNVAAHGFSAQEGGPVPGGYGGGDIISARLEPGEHVFTKEEVRAAGGHGAIFAMRGALGGGRQGGPGGYQAGGVAVPSSTPNTAVTSLGTQASSQQQSVQGVTGQFGAVLANINLFVKRFHDNWLSLWKTIANLTQSGIQDEEGYFQDLFDKVTQKLTDFQTTMTDSIQNFWKQTNSYVQDQLTTLFKNFQWTYTHLATDTFNIFWYINHVANQELKTFQAKPVQVQLAGQPTFATGGFIGQAGERGRDMVHAMLGRGEAVLNWSQQKLVDPALRSFYGFGLDKFFDKVRGQHAGYAGNGNARPGKFAAGGYVFPFPKNESFTWERVDQGQDLLGPAGGPILAIAPGVVSQASDRFSGFGPFYPTEQITGGPLAGRGVYYGHTKIAKTGRVNAGDIIAYTQSRANTWTAAPAGWLELGFLPYGSMTAGAAIAPILHELATGHRVSAGTGAGAAGLAGAQPAVMWSNITEKALKGSGVLKTVLQSVINRVLGAANAYGQSRAGQAGGAVGVPGSIRGPVAQQIAHALRALGWNRVAIAGAIGNAVQESSLVPGISGGGAAGLWQWTPPTALLNFASAHKQPWQSVAVQAALMSQTIGRSGIAAMNASSSAAAAAAWLMNNFEKPLASAANLPHRAAAAAAAFAAGLAGGGFAGGARPIMAHAGEWVVNQGQQSKLAGWLGTSRGGLQGALGFTGGPDSFQGGGVIGGNAPALNLQPQLTKGFGLPTLATLVGPGTLTFIDTSAQLVNRAQQVLINLELNLNRNSKKFGKAFGTYLDNLNAITGTGGLFDLASQELDTLTTQQGALTSLASAGLIRVTGAIKSSRNWVNIITRNLRSLSTPETALQAATLDLQTTRALGDNIRHLRDLAATALSRVNRQIADFGRITAKNIDSYRKLITGRIDLQNRVVDLDSRLAQNAQDTLNKQQTQFQAQIAQTLRGTATLTGGQIGGVTLGVDNLSPRLLQSGFNNLRGALGKVGPAIATGIAQMAQTIAQTLGDPQKLAVSDQAITDAATRQHDALQTAYAKAAAKAQKDPRWQSVADDLLSQLESSVTAVVQAQAQALTDAIQARDTASQRQITALSILDRFAAVRTALGDPFGGIAAQIATSRTRAGTLTSQIGANQALLTQAQALGMTQAINDLRDKIADLRAQVAEANLLTQQLVTSERQLAVTILTTQTQASSGFFSAANSIAQTLGAIAGNQNLPALIKYAKEAGASLIQQGAMAVANIRTALAADPTTGLFAFGANQGGAAAFLDQLTTAFQQGPQIFANTLAQLGPQLAGFEARLPPDQQALFQGLVQSLIDNTTSQVQNTQALQQLNAATNQQAFSSTAWQMFRDAIFNGLGGLLPQYAMTVPSLQMGGTLTRAGLVYGHTGESLVPANVSHGMRGLGDTHHTNHFNITNPTEVADPVILGNAIAWRLSHDPNSR